MLAQHTAQEHPLLCLPRVFQVLYVRVPAFLIKIGLNVHYTLATQRGRTGRSTIP